MSLARATSRSAGGTLLADQALAVACLQPMGACRSSLPSSCLTVGAGDLRKCHLSQVPRSRGLGLTYHTAQMAACRRACCHALALGMQAGHWVE